MALTTSPITETIVVLGLVGVLLGFFRHLAGKIISVLLIQIVVFIIFPGLLLKFVHLITSIRGSLS